MSEVTGKKQIYGAIIEVMKEVGYVQKRRGQNLNYTYAGEAALIQALRPAMVRNGLFIFPAAILHRDMDTYVTKNGAEMNRSVLTVRYTIAHVSGEQFDVEVVGEGSDVGDKSVNKALTGAYKYALRESFLIETGDDPDASASEPRAQQQQAKPRAQQPKPATQPATADIRGDSAPDAQAARDPRNGATPPPPPPTSEPETTMDDPSFTKRKLAQLHALGSKLYPTPTLWDDRRHAFGQASFKKPSSATWTVAEIKTATDKLQAKLDGFYKGGTGKQNLQAHMVALAELLGLDGTTTADAARHIANHEAAGGPLDASAIIKTWVESIHVGV